MKYDVLLLAGIIKKRRITLGYSLRSVAEQIGISHTELARIENGNRTNFSLIVIVRLCEILKIDFVNLLTITGYISSNSTLNDCYQFQEEPECEEDYDEELEDIVNMNLEAEISPQGDELYITIKLIND